MFKVSSPRLLDVIILSASAVVSLLIVALSDWNGDLYVENGPFEMLQVGALFAACVLFGRASGALSSSAGRLALGLALVSLLFLIRELPRCASPFYVAGPCMPGDSKTFAYLLPLALLPILLWRNDSLRLRLPRLADARLLPTLVRRLLPLVLVAILLVIGQFADSRNLPALEEISELSAYALLALAGLAAAQAGDRLRDSTMTGHHAGRHAWSSPWR